MHDSLERLSDSELVRRFGDGEEPAFSVLYARYRLPLYAYLTKMVNNGQGSIDDLYQQTWVKVIENIGRYREKQRFAAWLFRIAHNIAIDCFRHEARIRSVDVDHRIPDESQPVWELEDRANLEHALSLAIEGLPSDQREVVCLRRQGVPFKEIAEIQGVGINTVLGRMHYSVMRLRKQLQHLL